jgi:hypothetical protein
MSSAWSDFGNFFGSAVASSNPEGQAAAAVAKSVAPQTSSILGKFMTMPLIWFSVLLLVFGIFVMMFNHTMGMAISGIAVLFIMFGMYNLSR